MRRPITLPTFPAHLIATGFALLYAWKLSQTAYLTTGLQFIAPLLIIMVIHLMWLAASRDLKAGFSQIIYRRSAQSAVGLAVTIFLASVVAPAPAYAGSGIGQTILMVVFLRCHYCGSLRRIGGCDIHHIARHQTRFSGSPPHPKRP